MDNRLVEEINNNYRMVLLCTANVVDEVVPTDNEPSKYEVVIQTGAANTEKRIGQLNDHDGFEESISALNNRYGEFTAWFWAWKNIKTPYIGFCHYRRKWALTDEMLDQLMDEGVDIVGTAPERLFYNTVDEHYRRNHYGYDWGVMMDILKEKYPYAYGAAQNIFNQNCFHTRSIGIYKREVFEDCCSFVFSVAEEFMSRVPEEKKDRAQQRDTAFLIERLLSLYFDIAQAQGMKCYISRYWLIGEDDRTSVKKLLSEDEVISKCKNLINMNRWSDASGNMLDLSNYSSDECRLLVALITSYMHERYNLPSTFADYLECSDKYEEVMEYASMLASAIEELMSLGCEDSCDVFKEVIVESGISAYFVRGLMGYAGFENVAALNNMCRRYTNECRFTEATIFLEEALGREPENEETKTSLMYLNESIKQYIVNQGEVQKEACLDDCGKVVSSESVIR